MKHCPECGGEMRQPRIGSDIRECEVCGHKEEADR